MTSINADVVSDTLCDLYDIRNMAKQEGFGALPKDNDGTGFTIMECIENCIEHMEAAAGYNRK